LGGRGKKDGKGDAMNWWQVVIIIVAWDCVRLILQAIVNKWWLRKNKGIVWQEEKKFKQANPACRDPEGRDRCPHCDSYNVKYSNYEWFCLDCGEQWDQYGQDTK